MHDETFVRALFQYRMCVVASIFGEQSITPQSLKVLSLQK